MTKKSKSRTSRGTIGLTAGVTSAIVAKKSHNRPFQNIYELSVRVRRPPPTCLQRSFPKPNRVASLPRRSKPISIVRSKTTSEMSVTITLSLLFSVCSDTQALCSGTQTESLNY